MSSFEVQTTSGGTSAAETAAASTWTIFEGDASDCECDGDGSAESLAPATATTAAPISASVALVAVATLSSALPSSSASSSPMSSSTMLACVHNRRQAYARMSPQDAKCNSESIQVENFGEFNSQQVGNVGVLLRSFFGDTYYSKCLRNHIIFWVRKEHSQSFAKSIFQYCIILYFVITPPNLLGIDRKIA